MTWKTSHVVTLLAAGITTCGAIATAMIAGWIGEAETEPTSAATAPDHPNQAIDNSGGDVFVADRGGVAATDSAVSRAGDGGIAVSAIDSPITINEDNEAKAAKSLLESKALAELPPCTALLDYYAEHPASAEFFPFLNAAIDEIEAIEAIESAFHALGITEHAVVVATARVHLNEIESLTLTRVRETGELRSLGNVSHIDRGSYERRARPLRARIDETDEKLLEKARAFGVDRIRIQGAVARSLFPNAEPKSDQLANELQRVLEKIQELTLQGLDDQALEASDRAVGIAREVNSRGSAHGPEAIVTALMTRCVARDIVGDRRGALKDAEEAVDIARQLFAEADNPQNRLRLCAFLTERADLCWKYGQRQQARSDNLEATGLLDQVGSKPRRVLAVQRLIERVQDQRIVFGG